MKIPSAWPVPRRQGVYLPSQLRGCNGNKIRSMERFLLYATGIESNLCASFSTGSIRLCCYGMPHVKLLNIQGVTCADGGCVSAPQARKLGGLLAWGSFVSGCNDTRAYLWNL